jgi:hypothetical protein
MKKSKNGFTLQEGGGLFLFSSDVSSDIREVASICDSFCFELYHQVVD